MAKVQNGITKKSEKTSVVISHGVLCDIKALGAELSRKAGRMLSYDETLAALIAERKKG